LRKRASKVPQKEKYRARRKNDFFANFKNKGI
jgi:hypothetical protein